MEPQHDMVVVLLPGMECELDMGRKLFVELELLHSMGMGI